MKIEVKLFATLSRYLPVASNSNSATVQVPDGCTVGQLVSSLGIPGETPAIVLVNGCDASRAQFLRDGDVLAMFPPLAGGH